MANLGPIPVPAPLDKALPYVKFVIAVVALVAGVVVQVVAGPPAWVLLIVAVAGVLGVYAGPNKQLADDVQAIESGVPALVSAGETVLSDAKAKDVTRIFPDAETAEKAAVDWSKAVEKAGTDAEAEVAELKSTTTDPAEPGVDTSKTAVENEPENPGPPVAPVVEDKPEDPEPPVTKVGV